jgi:hypothetical protein
MQGKYQEQQKQKKMLKQHLAQKKITKNSNKNFQIENHNVTELKQN